MQIIKINPLNNITKINDSIVATLGQFDGLHLGHMQLINKCLEIKNKKKLKSALITFYPRVDVILNNDNENNYILDDFIFTSKLNNLQMDYLIIIEFSKTLSSLEHKDFLVKLIDNLNIKELVVGFDFTYGNKGLGNINTIYDDSNQRIKPIILDEYKIKNQKVGTNQIKQFLGLGQIEEANKFLGYNIVFKTTVVNNSLYSNNLHLLKNQKYLIKTNNLVFEIMKENNYIKFINNNIIFENENYIIEFIKES